MKFKLPQRTDLIIPNQDFASLEMIGLGFYRYSIKFEVNPVANIKNKISKIRVYATKDPNPKFNSFLFNALTLPFQDPKAPPLNGSDIVEKLLKKEALERAAVKTVGDSIFLEETVDYTSKIPNNLTGKLTAAQKNDEIIISKNREFINITISEARKQGISVTPLEQTQVNDSDFVYSSRNQKELLNDLVYNNGMDPANLATKENLIKFSIKTFGGVYQRTVLPTNIPKAIRNSIANIYTTKNTQITKNSLLPTSIIQIPVVKDKTTVSMNELLDVPMLSIGKEDFYFVLIAEDEFGIPLQKTIRPVDHSKNVLILETPLMPPLIKASNVKFGQNVLTIKQQDPNGYAVAIYRKILDRTTKSLDSEYAFVKQVPLTISQGEILVNDDVNTSNECFYRVVAVGINNQLSGDFNCISTKPKSIPFLNRTLVKKQNFAPFSYQLFSDSIELNIREIPQNVISVSVHKTIMSNKKNDSFFLIKPTTFTGNELTVSDSDVQVSKFYKYQYKFYYRDGTETWGRNELIIEFRPENKTIIDTKISQPRTVTKGNEIDITFNLDTSINETQENIVLNALSKQGISQFFSNDIQKNKLRDLIAYNITRHNDFTGETEDLGTTTSTNFSDSRQSSAVGAKPIKPGYKYTYTVKSYLRTPTTVLENYVEDVTVTNIPAKNYSYKPYFWKHPITLEQGNIVTQNSLNKNYAKNDFTFGQIGKISTVSVSLANIIPVIAEAICQRVNRNTIKIQWKINGPTTKVDHYVILMEILGVKTIIGKRHNVSDSNYFDYLDILTNGEGGYIIYEIVPVLFDFSKGTSVKTNGLVI